MTNLVFKNKGTLDKYMGDAIMAFWGAPIHFPDHAKHACRCALEMLTKLFELQEEFRQKGLPMIDIGIGLNTGDMSVGNMGSDTVRSYTVMGDAVNLGSRLEGITKQYGADIIIGEGTKALISGFVCRELDKVRVKGKDEPVAIYQPLGLEGQVDEARMAEINAWNQALTYYRAQQWDEAESQLRNLKKTALDSGLYDEFLDRIKHLRANPPGAEWDGVWKFETE